MVRSVKSSVEGWKTTGTILAVLIVIVMQALGLGAVWPQELAPPRIDEEIVCYVEVPLACTPSYCAA